MRSKIANEVDVRLPKGLGNILANFPKDPKPTKQTEITADDPNEVPKNSADNIWYVILEKWEKCEPRWAGDLNPMKKEIKWDWAFTRKFARDLARAAQKEGWKVIDVCKGTKKHVSNKYIGL